MKQVLFMLMVVLVSAHAESQDYDYLKLLNNFPPLPENTLNAGKAEKERFREKCGEIVSLLWELEEKMDNQPDSKLDMGDLDKIDQASKEWEEMYKPVLEIFTDYFSKKEVLNVRWLEAEEQLTGMNALVFEQLKPVLKNPHTAENKRLKEQLLQKLNDNRVDVYKDLAKINDNNLRELLHELKKIAPIVEKLDNFSLGGVKLGKGGVGLSLLQNYSKVLDMDPYWFNVVPGELHDHDSLKMMSLYK